MNQAESPVQEAVSIVSIVAILVAAVCYVGGANGWPILTPALSLIAEFIYAHFPALYGLRLPQTPLLVSVAAVGCVFWVLGMALSRLIAQGFSNGYVAQMERQTRNLRKNRARIKTKQRRADDFTAH